PPVQWPAGGWPIQPDMTVELPPYPVPAHGILDWQTLAIRSPFKEDTWITGIEVLPSEPSVVHHICFNIEQPTPGIMYDTYEWVEVPRDQDGITIRRPEQEQASAIFPEGVVVTREVGSTEEKRRVGKPVIPRPGALCYLPGLPYEDYRSMNAAFLAKKG